MILAERAQWEDYLFFNHMSESQVDILAAMNAQMRKGSATDPRELFEAVIDDSKVYRGGAAHVSEIAQDPKKYGEELSNLTKDAAA